MDKNILITWIAWFIAWNLANELITKWWNIVWVDNLSTWHMQNMKELIQNDNFTFLKEDIRNFEKIDEIIKLIMLIIKH